MMVVVPTSPSVTLSYGYTAIDLLAMMLTVLAIGVVVWLAWSNFRVTEVNVVKNRSSKSTYLTSGGRSEQTLSARVESDPTEVDLPNADLTAENIKIEDLPEEDLPEEDLPEEDLLEEDLVQVESRTVESALDIDDLPSH